MNVSRFRKEYRDLTDAEEELIQMIKSRAQDLEEFIEQMDHSREKSLALTNLEQAVMWATQGITA